MKTTTLLLIGLLLPEAKAEQIYHASDVLRYALTAHGITYKLRDKKGSVNRWKADAESLKGLSSVKKMPAKRWGNTDCSGLASAAWRYLGFERPEDKKVNVMSTFYFNHHPKWDRRGMIYVGNYSSNKSKLIQHGDVLNRTSKPYGHVLLFNGLLKSGKFSSAEAKGSKFGVGAFTRSWNQMGRFRIIRSKHILNDFGSKYYSVPLSEAKVVVSTAGKLTKYMKPVIRQAHWIYLVQKGDSAETIAVELDTTVEELKALNPKADFERLKLGQKLRAPLSTLTAGLELKNQRFQELRVEKEAILVKRLEKEIRQKEKTYAKENEVYQAVLKKEEAAQSAVDSKQMEIDQNKTRQAEIELESASIKEQIDALAEDDKEGHQELKEKLKQLQTDLANKKKETKTLAKELKTARAKLEKAQKAVKGPKKDTMRALWSLNWTKKSLVKAREFAQQVAIEALSNNVEEFFKPEDLVAQAESDVPDPSGEVQVEDDKPKPTPAPRKRTYKVRRGDTLTKIARKLGTTIKKLKKKNPILYKRKILRIGQILKY
jgi:LysM repeat protein